LGRPATQSDMQKAATQALCRWLDKLQINPSALNGKQSNVDESGNGDGMFQVGGICIVATSNRAADVNPLLRRGGRLERTVHITTSPEDRRVLLHGLLQHVLPQATIHASAGLSASPVSSASLAAGAAAVFSRTMADRTGGYSAADLVALVGKMQKYLQLRALKASNRHTDDLLQRESDDIVMMAFDAAQAQITPSCLRGVSVAIPHTSYADIIGLEATKTSLQRVLKFASPSMRAQAAAFGLGAPGGVLLHGPPGNSKTRLVMAAASAHGLPVISLSSADVYSPYVGDAEAEVRRAFAIAHQAAPCILFLDELDALVTNRGIGAGSSGGSASVEARVLATLLTEMDGIGGGDRGVVVLAATNRVDCIDAALLRKGRFHHVLEVPPPDLACQALLLSHFSARSNLPAESTELLKSELKVGLSGADVENLCREEGMRLMRMHLASASNTQ